MRRRRYIALAGSTAVLAGCLEEIERLDGEEDDPDPDEFTRDGDGDDGVDSTADDSGDSSNDVDEDVETTAVVDSDAEEPVRGYLEGVDTGDEHAANEFVHRESDFVLEEGEIAEPGVEIHEVAVTTYRELLEAETDLEGEALETAIEDEEERVASLAAEHGFEAHAYVSLSITSEQYGDEEGAILVVNLEGEWLLFGDASV